MTGSKGERDIRPSPPCPFLTLFLLTHHHHHHPPPTQSPSLLFSIRLYSSITQRANNTRNNYHSKSLPTIIPSNSSTPDLIVSLPPNPFPWSFPSTRHHPFPTFLSPHIRTHPLSYFIIITFFHNGSRRLQLSLEFPAQIDRNHHIHYGRQREPPQRLNANLKLSPQLFLSWHYYPQT